MAPSPANPRKERVVAKLAVRVVDGARVTEVDFSLLATDSSLRNSKSVFERFGVERVESCCTTGIERTICGRNGDTVAIDEPVIRHGDRRYCPYAAAKDGPLRVKIESAERTRSFASPKLRKKHDVVA